MKQLVLLLTICCIIGAPCLAGVTEINLTVGNGLDATLAWQVATLNVTVNKTSNYVEYRYIWDIGECGNIRQETIEVADDFSNGDVFDRQVNEGSVGSVKFGYLDMWDWDGTKNTMQLWCTDGSTLDISFKTCYLPSTGMVTIVGEPFGCNGMSKAWTTMDVPVPGTNCQQAIPAPGAIILVSLGCGFVGWFRR